MGYLLGKEIQRDGDETRRVTCYIAVEPNKALDQDKKDGRVWWDLIFDRQNPVRGYGDVLVQHDTSKKIPLVQHKRCPPTTPP